MADTLYMVIPCYNEEAVLRETASRMKEKYVSLIGRGFISPESRIVFVNDGSKDSTWQIIEELHCSEPAFFSGIDLARNSGHQNAVLAGLMTVKDICDMAITMDADLQDDINAIDAMIEKYNEGCQVVYGVRSARKTDTFFKRFAGESKYPLKKMLAFAVNGITSFSTKPLKLITGIGFLMSLISAAAIIWAFVVKILGHSELGWSSTMCSIWFIGGIQILALGIIGEYIGKIYAEVKQRPRYIVADFINDTEKRRKNDAEKDT